MPDNLDPVILAKLQPRAQQLARATPPSPRVTSDLQLMEQNIRLRREQKRYVVNQLWAEAHRQGLTKFAVPPILVSLFCRALWSVVWYLAQQILNRKAD